MPVLARAGTSALGASATTGGGVAGGCCWGCGLFSANRFFQSSRSSSCTNSRRSARRCSASSKRACSWQLAVLTVVAGEIQRAGACTWCLDRIAAVAGVCKTLARDAIRKARHVGLLFSVERRRRGQKSLTNIVRVLRKSWGAWLQRIGCRKMESTSDKILRNGASIAVKSNGDGPHDPLRRWKGS